jgi:amino acid adenylation domain-containing protein
VVPGRELNQFAFARQPTLVHHLRASASTDPARRIFQFIKDDGVGVSFDYAQLDRDARRLAVWLGSLAAEGDRVILMHAPGAAYVQALLGCFYAGLVAVPAYPPHPNRSMERLRSLVTDAQARLALTTDATLKRLWPQIQGDEVFAGLSWVPTDLLPESVSIDDWREPDIRDDSLALLQYTSGSTAAPKGVMITHGHFRNNVQAMALALEATRDDRMVTWLPPYHDMGLVGGVLAPLFLGLDTVVLTPGSFLQRPLRWLSAIAEHRATISGAPNFGYELCARRIGVEQRQKLDLSTWRVAFCGAERVRAGTLQRFTREFAISGFRPEAFVPCYGLAEATLAVCFSPGGPRFLDVQSHLEIPAPNSDTSADALSRVSVSCGTSAPGVEVVVADAETRRRLPEGAVGELWVRGNAVALGYWNKPALSADTFQARLVDEESAPWLRTGDLGFLQHGQLHVLGRLKDLIIVRGVNVYPDDVEAVAERAHECLHRAAGAAFGIDVDGEERLVLVQEYNPGVRDEGLDEVARAIAQGVAESLQVAVYQVVLVAPGGVPRTSSGKVQRGRCREMYLAHELRIVHDSSAQPVELVDAPPDLVAQVAQLMAQVLGAQTVMPDDDFFWLGGHSLLATQLVSRVRAAFAIEVSLGDVFDATTPRRLAARIAKLPAIAIRPQIQRVDRAGRLPMTFSQQRMWLLHQLDPRGTAYNVAGAVQISGPLDLQVLSRAFAQVEATHEILRTRYPTTQGEADVRVVEANHTTIETVDLSAETDAPVRALERATELARTPFDIATEPLVRVRLFRVGPDNHVLAVCIHHLVTDAWSMGILVRDLLACYDALVAGQPLDLPVPAIGYIDYAGWQREFMTGAYLQSQADYWREQLRGAEAIELPSDRPRAQLRSSAGDFEPLALSDELMGAIESLAHAHCATPFMVMLAAFDVLLYRWTGRTDLVVGVPVANRNWQESEAVMGTLVNTLALRTRFAEDTSFVSLLRDVRQRALEAYANQDLPFEKLITELPVERKPGVSPLVSVMFDYQNTPLSGRGAGGVRLRPLILSRGSAQFDLSLLILDTELGRIAGIEYSTDLFPASTIRRMLGHYLTLLEAALQNPETAVDRLPLLTPDERQDLLAWSRRSCHEGVEVRPLMDLIEAQCLQGPTRSAVQDGTTSLTYAGLQEAVHRLSSRLTALGIAPGMRVAVCLERGVDLVVALLAVMRGGAAYVPLDPGHPGERLGHILQDARPALLLTRARLPQARAFADSVRLAFLEDLAEPIAAADASRLSAVPIDEGLPAYVIYTSGSTGRPKGVEVSRRSLANFVSSMQQTPGMSPEDRVLAVTTVAFDIAGLELYVPLATGACVHVASSEVVADGQGLARLMDQLGITFMQATPATWRLLVESGWQGSKRLKILCGGEAFPRDLVEPLLARADSVWNMYGPTETTVWSTIHKVSRDAQAGVPIGAPIAETSVYILDRHLNPVPREVAGEIWIGGLGVANGYVGAPAMTAERFVPDTYQPRPGHPGARLYRTGDAGRYRGDGLLEHLGRLDDQIKIRGFRIEPAEIEQLLVEHRGVRDAVVVAREIGPGDTRLVAYYVPEGNGTAAGVGASELLDALRHRLPAYMIPSAFIPVETMPRTPNNKIDKRALPTPALDAQAGDGEYAPPADELEEALAGIWQRLLGVQRVGSRDSFFVLGGHSLLAVRLFAQIQRRFSVNLPLAILFERPTIAFLAEAIREARAGVRLPGLYLRQRSRSPQTRRFVVPIQAGGGGRPFFCVHGAGGNVLNLWALARHLGREQPFFGIQAQGVDGLSPPMDDIRQMALAYLEEILQVQPRGPYLLGGYCAGGWVALEVARELTVRGERVALLALIDCYHPRTQLKRVPFRSLLRGLLREGPRYLWLRAPARLSWYLKRLVVQVLLGWCRLVGRPVPLALREDWLIDAMTRGASRFRPSSYDGNVVLLRAREVEGYLEPCGPQMGWGGLFSGSTRYVDIPGNHHSLAEEPNVQQLAILLKSMIAEEAPEPAPASLNHNGDWT